MPPLPKHPSARQRGRKSTTAATLPSEVDHEIPPLPPAAEWLSVADDTAVDWPKAVVDWWTTVWQSPMSNEFTPSDLPQLYLAAFYLSQVVDSRLKITQRLAAGRQHEALVKNFGLTPMARRSLQWEIEKVSEAQERADRRSRTGTTAPAATSHRPDPRLATEDDEDNPFTRKRLEREAARR